VRDRLAVQDDPGDRQGHDGGDRNEVGAPVSAVAAPQPDLVAVLVRDDPEAVMLQLVQPSVAVREREHGQSGADKARRLAAIPGERRTHQHV